MTTQQGIRVNGPYVRFKIHTQPFASPTRFGYTWFLSALDKVREDQTSFINWLDMEQFMRDVLESRELNDELRVRLLKEAVGAYTRRES